MKNESNLQNMRIPKRMARELPRNLIIITFIGLGPAKCERRGKRGEARNKRGGSGASRTGLSGAQGQTRPSVSKRQFGNVETKGSFAKKGQSTRKNPSAAENPLLRQTLVTNVNMRLFINIQRNGRNEEKYVV